MPRLPDELARADMKKADEEDEEGSPPQPRNANEKEGGGPATADADDASGEEPPYPVFFFCRFLVHNPFSVMAVCFILVVICASLGIIYSGDFAGSFTDVNHIIVKRKFGIERGMNDWPMAEWTVAWEEEPLFEEGLFGVAPQQTVDMGDPIQIIFRSKSGNALKLDTIKDLAWAEQHLAGTAGYDKLCLRGNGTGDGCVAPSSPVNVATWVNGMEDGTVVAADRPQTCLCAEAFGVPCAAFDAASVADFGLPAAVLAGRRAALPSTNGEFETRAKGTLRAICEQTVAPDDALLDYCSAQLLSLGLDILGKDAQCPADDAPSSPPSNSVQARYIRSLLPFGGPLKRGKDDEDGWLEERDAFDDVVIYELFAMKEEVEEKNDDLEVFFWGGSGLISYYLNQDLRMLGLSFFLVFCCLWAQTSSLFITVCGLFEIIVSYPLGLFVWHVILREPYVTYLMYNGIFIILGIGADDIFVLSDAFKQSANQPPHISGSLETRFAWAYNRAASAMLATSLTTCAAFAACAVSPIWDIKCFGCVASVMILCDYLLVITWLPASIIIHEKYMLNCCPWFTPGNLLGKLSKCCCRSKEKTVGAASSSAAAPSAEVVAISGSKASLQDEKTETSSSSSGDNVGARSGGSDDVGGGGGGNVRFLERFYGGPYADFIIKYGKPIVAFYVALFVVSVTVAAVLVEPATEQQSFFDDDHFYIRSQAVASEKFGLTASEEVSFLGVTLGYGLKQDDPWDLRGVHPCDVEDESPFMKTRSKYKKGFDLADHQEGFSSACAAFAAKLLDTKESASATAYYCWIDQFADWARDKGYGFPVPAETFRAKAVEWRDSAGGWSNASAFFEAEGLGSDYNAKTGFLEDGSRVFYTWASFNLTQNIDDLISAKIGFSDMWQSYDHAEAARRAAEKASGMSGGVQSILYYDWMVAGRVFLQAGFENMAVALATAVAVILAMTMNYKVTLICLASLLCTVSLVFLLIVVVGWKINIIESIGLSIATGLAVDYVLHLAHSFNHQHGSASTKTRLALAEMGISITSGCATTFFACIALFLCDFLWFRIFGCFITMLILSSFFTSMGGMMAALSFLGPGDFPDGVVFLPVAIQNALRLQKPVHA